MRVNCERRKFDMMKCAYSRYSRLFAADSSCEDVAPLTRLWFRQKARRPSRRKDWNQTFIALLAIRVRRKTPVSFSLCMCVFILFKYIPQKTRALILFQFEIVTVFSHCILFFSSSVSHIYLKKPTSRPRCRVLDDHAQKSARVLKHSIWERGQGRS